MLARWCCWADCLFLIFGIRSEMVVTVLWVGCCGRAAPRGMLVLLIAGVGRECCADASL